MNKKPKVLFVGSFLGGLETSFGGTNQACKLLLKSEAWDNFDWILIDSTQVKNPPPKLLGRFRAFFKRFHLVVNHIIYTDLDGALAFSGSSVGLWEKSLYLGIFRLFKRKPTFLFYRGSGVITHKKILSWTYKISLSLPEYIFVQSEHWKEVLSKNFGRNDLSLFVINNWVEVEKGLIRSNRSNETKIKILFTGWVHESKGIFDLVLCGKKIKSLDLSVQFIIAGTGKDFNNMKAQVEAFGLCDIFHFTGWVNRMEILKLLNSCDIFVLPSYGEGMPNSLLEAMSLKIPCVASNVGSIPEVIDHGKDGMLFEAGDVRQLEDILIYLYENRNFRHNLGEKAYSKMEKNYELNLNCSRFLNIIQSKIENKD